MNIWLILFLVLMPFAAVLLFGAPYLPTRKKQINDALNMLDLEEGQVFVDLGCGDGAVLLEAARRGYKCYGYELNPLMWIVAKLRTLRFGRQITIYCRNFWAFELPKNTKGVFVFLLQKYMAKLDRKLEAELPPGAQLVSYTFQIPERKPHATQGALFLYKY